MLASGGREDVAMSLSTLTCTANIAHKTSPAPFGYCACATFTKAMKTTFIEGLERELQALRESHSHVREGGGREKQGIKINFTLLVNST